MKTAIKTQTILTAIALFTLSACGGGGASSNLPDASNISPTATAQAHIIDEDVSLGLTLSGTDSDGSISSYSITSSPSNGSITGTGSSFIYTPNVNFSGTDSVTFTVTDNDGAVSGPATIEITINAVNDAPVAALLDEYSITENSAESIALLDISVTDPEQDDFTYALGEQGDTSLFIINPTSSGLEFITAPDFEAPIDANADNTYEVEIIFTDIHGAASSKLMNVNVIDESNIQINMTYPTPNANLGGQATQTTIRGNLVDLEDGEVLVSDVNEVQVNGIAATLDDTNTLWSTTVDISEEVTNLSVKAFIDSDMVQSVSPKINNTALPIDLEVPIRGALDITNNRVIVLDVAYDAIFSVDLDTGEVTVISDENQSEEPLFENPYALALDSANNLVYVADTSLQAIFRVNLVTGDRTIISDDETGDGFTFDFPRDIAFDETNNQLYVVDSSRNALFLVDTESGDRNIISSDEAGTGELHTFPTDLTVDFENNQAYILDRSYDSIFLIDLTTGNRTQLPYLDNGEDGTIDDLRTICLSADKSELLIYGEASDEPRLVSINLSTYKQSLVSNTNLGSGVDFIGVRDMFLDASKENILMLDGSVESIISTNLDSGNRQTVPLIVESDFIDPFDLTLDIKNQVVYVADEDAIHAIDVGSTETAGDIEILTNLETGTGPTFGGFVDVSVDPLNNRLFAIDSDIYASRNNRLLSIDLTTGDRTEMIDTTLLNNDFAIFDLEYDALNNRLLLLDSSNNGILVMDLSTFELDVLVGDIEITSFNNNLVLDVANNRALVIKESELVAIDLSTGIEDVISGFDVGSGSELGSPRALAFDESKGLAYIVNTELNEVLTIDTSTGNRNILSYNNAAVPFRAVSSLIVDTDNNRLFLSDWTEDSIFVIDIPTGERAVVAH